MGYIIAKLKGNLGRTKLFKLTYLGDLFSRMVRARPITSFEYKLFPKGPMDNCMYDSIHSLKHNGHVEELFHEEWEGYSYSVKKNVETNLISDEEKFILDQVIAACGNMPLDYLLDEVVYKTEPVSKAKEARKTDVAIDMDCVNNKLNPHSAFDFSTYVQSTKDIERDQRLSLSDLLNAL